MPVAATSQQVPHDLPAELTTDLITYIGNKRALLPWLASILLPLREESESPVLLDPMCGSGGVSRLAKFLGFCVHANDWEPYAAAVTTPYVALRDADVDRIYAEWGGADRFFAEVNAAPSSTDPFVARYYAPEQTSAPRLGRERLFYTAENAERIDAIRDAIDRLVPPERAERDPTARHARFIALAQLLVQASRHANTSGVFKAYHRGYGGLGRDALARILRRIECRPPRLIDGPTGTVACEDASVFLGHASGDVCYVDPPYSGHQYGSNYFMLNTILRWDRVPPDESRDAAGFLLSKAGIPPTWRETRSEFCSRPAAPGAMRDLIDRIDARWIVLSYSTDGIVPIDELCGLAAERGSVSLQFTRVASYRGGRQSLSRAATTGEFALVVDTRRPSGRHAAVARTIAMHRLQDAASRRFAPVRVRSRFDVAENGAIRLVGRGALAWSAFTDDCYRLDIDSIPDWVSEDELNRVAHDLDACACADYGEELRIVLSFLRSGKHRKEYQRSVASCLRKFAYRKYRDQFLSSLQEVRDLLKDDPGALGRFSTDVDAIAERAKLRFASARGAQARRT